MPLLAGQVFSESLAITQEMAVHKVFEHSSYTLTLKAGYTEKSKDQLIYFISIHCKCSSRNVKQLTLLTF